MSDPTYTIVGAGAIGGTLAVHLHAKGVPVQLVDADAAHVAAIRENGLTLLTPDGVLVARIPVFTLDDAPAGLTRVLLAVKAQATSAASAWIAPRLSPDGFVASLQNGLNEETIASFVGVDRTVIAFVDLFADVMEPGIVKDGGHGGMALGEYAGGTSDRVRALADDLSHWGSPVVSENVEGFLWAKLAFGAMLVTTALADEDMSVLIDRHRATMNALAAEVIAVADHRGIVLEGFDAFQPAAFRRGVEPAVNAAAIDALVAWLATQSKTRSGIWRDIAVRKRPTEVPTQYGPVLAAAEDAGIEVPYLRAMVARITQLERGEIAMDEALLHELDSAVAL
jgi:2-dehydropantoate 2-reductase